MKEACHIKQPMFLPVQHSHLFALASCFDSNGLCRYLQRWPQHLTGEIVRLQFFTIGFHAADLGGGIKSMPA